MEHNFRIYYDRDSGLACLDLLGGTNVHFRAYDIECNVPVFGIRAENWPMWSLAGTASLIYVDGNRIIVK